MTDDQDNDVATNGNPIVEAVFEFCKRGLPIVPCDGKAPTQKDWQHRTNTADEVIAELRRLANPMIGLRLGPDSFIDIEADSDDEEHAFAELFAGCDLPITPTFASTRGKHRLFKWDPRLAETDAAVVSYRGTNGAKLGIRIGAGNKGAQSIIPPSTGRTWLVDGNDCNPAELPDAVVQRIITAAKPHSTARHESSESTNGRPNTLEAVVCELAGAYLAKFTPAVSGQGGHNRTFHAARVLTQGFALEREPALELLRKWNLSCKPPWSEAELKHKIDDALKQPGKRGFFLSSVTSKSLEKFEFAELRRQYPTLNPPVIEGLIREGETANVISTSKIGKSWLAYGMALSVITGRQWLNRFATAAGKVLLVDNELHRSTLSDRFPKVADAMAIPGEHYEHDLEVWPLRGDLRSLADLEDEFDTVEPRTFKLIILDAMYRFAIESVSENDNAAMAIFYNLLDRIAARTNAAIVLIHHTTKGNQSEKRVTDVGAGAGAQSRAADCHLILREHVEPGVVVLDAAVRSFAPVEPLALRWVFPVWVPTDDGVDTADLKGRKSANEERQDERDRAGIDIITKALRGGPATPRVLRDRTGLSEARLKRLLGQMTYEGLVASEEVTIRGNHTNVYKLVENPY